MVDFDATNPTDNAIVSQYPINERAARAALVSGFGLEHDSDGAGRHKFPTGDTSARDALTGMNEGTLFVNTSAGAGNYIIEIFASATSVWETTGRFTSADEAKLDGIASGAGVVPAQVTANEISAGTVTSTRMYSPADIVSFVSAHTSVTQVFTEQFISSELSTVAGGAVLSVNHGLSNAPVLVQARLICKVSSLGYAVGEELIMSNTPYGTSTGFTIVPDATKLLVQMGTALITINNRTNGGQSSITAANFNLILYAWA